MTITTERTTDIDATPSPYDRVALVGKNGSGKTYAAGILTRGLRRLVAIDSKGISLRKWGLEDFDPVGRIRFKGANRATRLRDALEDGSTPVRLRIVPGVGYNYERLFEYLYTQRNLTIYIDELYAVLPPSGRSPYLQALYTRGRELGIGTWASMQRPSWVPLYSLSESEWIYLFRLQLAADRKRMMEMIGDDAGKELKGHELLVYHQSWNNPAHYAGISAD